MANGKRKISTISACYNEARNIMPLYERLIKALGNFSYELEIIFVDNSSTDNSEEIFRGLAEKDKRVKVLFMSRNFGGPQTSYFAGLQYCSGDAAILLDGDLQDPPEVIPELIKKWEEGYDVVYGIRAKRKAKILKRLFYKLFYRVFKKLAYIDIPLDAGEFGLMDRKVVNEIADFSENEVLVRGLRAFVGFKQVGVEYVRDDRNAGSSTTSFWQDLKWAKKFIINFSYKPLEWISYVAFFAFLVSCTGILLNFVLYLSNPYSPPGIPTIIFAIFFFGAVQLLSLSIIGEYLSKVLQEVKNRPRYILKEILNDERNKNKK